MPRIVMILVKCSGGERWADDPAILPSPHPPHTHPIVLVLQSPLPCPLRPWAGKTFEKH